jgi:pSer/pThr/pTyr-binding forkhead associated (FHA) protein
VPEPLARLIELDPEGRAGRVHELHPGVWLLGRETGADVVLAHADVSRRHAELTITGEGATLRDLGSKNGVMVAGRKLGRAPLEDGAQLEIGELRLVFEHDGARIDRLLARSGEPTVRRPRELDTNPGAKPAAAVTPPRAGASLIVPVLSALAFGLLLTMLLVFG